MAGTDSEETWNRRSATSVILALNADNKISEKVGAAHALPNKCTLRHYVFVATRLIGSLYIDTRKVEEK